jgi:hypothetical protein
MRIQYERFQIVADQVDCTQTQNGVATRSTDSEGGWAGFLKLVDVTVK